MTIGELILYFIAFSFVGTWIVRLIIQGGGAGEDHYHDD